MKLHLTGDVSQVKKGLKLLLKELGIELAKEGHHIHVKQRKGPLSVKNENIKGEILFQKRFIFLEELDYGWSIFIRKKILPLWSILNLR